MGLSTTSVLAILAAALSVADGYQAVDHGHRSFFQRPVSRKLRAAEGTANGTDLFIVAYSSPDGLVLSSAAPEGYHIKEKLERSGFTGAVGTTRLIPLFKDETYNRVLIAGAGDVEPKDDGLDPKKDNLRQAMAFGMRGLRSAGATDVHIDCVGAGEVAGEGVGLGLYRYEQFLAKKSPIVKYKCINKADRAGFTEGEHTASIQNFVRSLAETPANEMWPEVFVEWVEKEMKDIEGVTITAHGDEWMKKMGFGAHLSVSAGSVKPGRFLVIEYINGVAPDTPPAVLVGKGITFDSGGISLKSTANMVLMRADMEGAANVVGAVRGLAEKKVKGRYFAIGCMAENMPSGSATRVSDIVTAYNNVTIEVANTDAEGRMVMADGLSYATAHLNPRMLMTVATLTGAIMGVTDSQATGCFTKSKTLFQELQKGGHTVGERMWRMPTYHEYDEAIVGLYSDIKNSAYTSQAGASTAAAFLRRFVKTNEYIHLDIAGVMHHYSTVAGTASGILGPGMSGRPVRAIMELMKSFSWE